MALRAQARNADLELVLRRESGMGPRSHHPAATSRSEDQQRQRRRRNVPGMGVGETIAFVVGLVAIVVVVVAFL
jgi:hypothetical protein